MWLHPLRSHRIAASPPPPRQSRAAPLPPHALQTHGRVKTRQRCIECGQGGKCINLTGIEIIEHLAEQGLSARRWSAAHIYVWCVNGASAEGAIEIQWGFMGTAWFMVKDAATYAAVTPRRAHAATIPVLDDPDKLDAILRTLARTCGLSDVHRKKLVDRGYAGHEIGPGERFLFASLAEDTGERPRRGRIALALLARETAIDRVETLLGVYGFERDHRRADSIIEFLPNRTSAGILEFSVDAAGRVFGYEYAPDDPGVEANGKPGAKRISPHRFTKSGRYHLAIPIVDDGTHLYHTEGTHKANLICDALHAPAVGTFGMGNASAIINAAKDLDPNKERVHVLTLDSNQWTLTPEQIAEHKKLHKTIPTTEGVAARDLAAGGWRVALARWDVATGANGPDDAQRATMTTGAPSHPGHRARTSRMTGSVAPSTSTRPISSAFGRKCPKRCARTPKTHCRPRGRTAA